MSTYSNQLQPALQNLLQCVVRFFHPRSSCKTTHISCIYRIGGRSENNIKCVVHDDLGWKNWITWYILLRHWLYEWFSQFHRCGTYSVLSRSPSIVFGRPPQWEPDIFPWTYSPAHIHIGHFPLNVFPTLKLEGRTFPPPRSVSWHMLHRESYSIRQPYIKRKTLYSPNRTQRKMLCNQWLNWETRSGELYIHFWSPFYNTAYY